MLSLVQILESPMDEFMYTIGDYPPPIAVLDGARLKSIDEDKYVVVWGIYGSPIDPAGIVFLLKEDESVKFFSVVGYFRMVELFHL